MWGERLGHILDIMEQFVIACLFGSPVAKTPVKEQNPGGFFGERDNNYLKLGKGLIGSSNFKELQIYQDLSFPQIPFMVNCK